VDAIPISVYVSAGKVPLVLLKPESRTLATSTSSLHAKDVQPDFVDAIPTSVYVSAGKVPFAPLGPESRTSVVLTSHLHARDLQPDFVDEIVPTSVYVSAGKVPIEACLSLRTWHISASPSIVRVMLRRRP